MKRDFIEEGFLAIDEPILTSADSWLLTFPTLDAHGREWRKQAADFTRRFKSGLREALYEATRLSDFEIVGGAALVHMTFNGWLTKANDQRVNLQWQTLFIYRKHEERWKITSFTGYLPNVFLESDATEGEVRKRPPNVWQHVHSLSDVQSRVVEEALGRLRATRLTVAEIAAEPGFCDEFHFSRSFKKITGQSPAAFRRHHLARR